MSLPPNATEASRKRFALANKLVESCPLTLADEVALISSTAQGLAFDDDKLILRFWNDTIPSADACTTWLKREGVQEIEFRDRPYRDPIHLVKGMLEDVPVKLIWQTHEVMNTLIAALLAGERQHVEGSEITTAIVLRTQGTLFEWQNRLNIYSDVVQERSIQWIISDWQDEKRFHRIAKLAKRNERLTLTHEYWSDLHHLLSLFYAINRQWYPHASWELGAAQKLKLAPSNWRGRFDAVLTLPTVESFPVLIQLILDALALVPPQYDVSEAVRVVRAFAGEDE